MTEADHGKETGTARRTDTGAGHASPTTTAIYAKTNNTARKRQVEALDEDEMS